MIVKKSHDNRSLRKVSVILIGLALVTGGLFFASQASSQEASESAVSKDQIEENLQDRLQQALKENEPVAHLKRAWIGPLESIANHTLTIETKDGPKLASVSAETLFIRMPKRTTITIDDLEIGMQTIAMGMINGNKVLEALRVISYETPPEKSVREVYFATQLSYDPQEDLLTFAAQSGETRSVGVTQDTLVTTSQDGEIVESDFKEISPNSRAIMIIKTEKTKAESMTLLRVHVLPTSEASESEGLEDQSLPATDGAQGEESSLE